MRRQKEKNRGSSKKRTRGTARDSLAETEDFLKKNRLKADVIETPSGLQYTIVNPGEGASPTEWSTVEVNQRILLMDGTVTLLHREHERIRSLDPGKVNWVDAYRWWKCRDGSTP